MIVFQAVNTYLCLAHGRSDMYYSDRKRQPRRVPINPEHTLLRAGSITSERSPGGFSFPFSCLSDWKMWRRQKTLSYDEWKGTVDQGGWLRELNREDENCQSKKSNQGFIRRLSRVMEYWRILCRCFRLGTLEMINEWNDGWSFRTDKLWPSYRVGVGKV